MLLFGPQASTVAPKSWLSGQLVAEHARGSGKLLLRCIASSAAESQARLTNERTGEVSQRKLQAIEVGV